MRIEDKNLLDWLSKPGDTMDSFSIKVSKFFTDVDGQIIDKNSVPIGLQTKYPVFLFNTFDHNGAYKISLTDTPVQGDAFFYRFYVESEGYDPLQFSGFNTIESQITTGDLVFVFTDDLANPNFFIYLIHSITNRSVASIIKTLPCSGLEMGMLKLFYDNTLNFNELLRFVKTNQLGIYKSDSIAPLAYKTPDYQQVNVIDISLKNFRLTPYLGINTYIQHTSDILEFDFEFLNIS